MALHRKRTRPAEMLTGSASLLFLMLASSQVRLGRTRPTNDIQQTCSLSPDVLAQLKSSIEAITRDDDGDASNGLPQLTDIHEQCKGELGFIQDSLQRLGDEYRQLKTDAVSREDVDMMRNNYEEEIQKLVKKRDLFETESAQKAKIEQGQVQSKIHSLTLAISELNAKIEQAWHKYYGAVFELLQLKIRNHTVDNSTLQYAEKVPADRMGQLFDSLSTDAQLLYDTLVMFKLSDVALQEKVFTQLLQWLEGKGKNGDTRDKAKEYFIAFLCWITNRDDLMNLVRTHFSEMQRVGKIIYAGMNQDQKQSFVDRNLVAKCKGIFAGVFVVHRTT